MKSKFEGRSPIIAEINVVPLVDIILVILIIFIVSAPLFLTSSIKVELPTASSSERRETKTLTLTIDVKSQMDLDGMSVDQNSLITHLKSKVKQNTDVHIAIAADRNLTHGKVVDVIDLLNKNGIHKFSINVTQ
ncbi:MAG: biopolymer transporter ExbD [Bacteriovoracaceae bacterium]|nr:biopolymer transporter ExbD [Bacteriovoracaceae bacterium]